MTTINVYEITLHAHKCSGGSYCTCIVTCIVEMLCNATYIHLSVIARRVNNIMLSHEQLRRDTRLLVALCYSVMYVFTFGEHTRLRIVCMLICGCIARIRLKVYTNTHTVYV